MTRKEALKLLGLPPQADLVEIKKKYRQLMHQVHPDAASPRRDRNTLPGARQLNQAYALLKREGAPGGPAFTGSDSAHFSHKKRKSPEKTGVWNAPVNSHAYTGREILHCAEDAAGNPLGHFSIAYGKYLWTMEEDFPLFLSSIFRCSKKLLDEIDSQKPTADESQRLIFQAELAYLLAQQFLDGRICLPALAQEEPPAPDGSRIFRVPSMLEFSRTFSPLKPGEPLYPSALRCHRLYLKNEAGKELGYLSFPDDRLYYVVIPLFEQRNVRLRILASNGSSAEKKKGSANYQNLSLWIKLPSSGIRHAPENLNLRIAELLKKYQSGCPSPFPSI